MLKRCITGSEKRVRCKERKRSPDKEHGQSEVLEISEEDGQEEDKVRCWKRNVPKEERGVLKALN